MSWGYWQRPHPNLLSALHAGVGVSSFHVYRFGEVVHQIVTSVSYHDLNYTFEHATNKKLRIAIGRN